MDCAAAADKKTKIIDALSNNPVAVDLPTLEAIHDALPARHKAGFLQTLNAVQTDTGKWAVAQTYAQYIPV